MTVSRFGIFSRAITQASIIAVADDDLFEAQRAHMKIRPDDSIVGYHDANKINQIQA
jgi:hypothetical protein